MKTYIFIQSGSDKRGYNVNVRVYRMKNNFPEEIGNSDWQTASWPGARGAAVKIISEADGHKSDGFSFERKDIRIVEV